MKRNIFRLGVAGVFIMAFNRAGNSQSASPLAPPLPSPRAGVEAGASFNSESGSFQTDCGCQFTSGTGSGFVAGAVGEWFLSNTLELMGKFSFHAKNITANTSNDTDEMAVDPTTNTIIRQPVGLAQQASAKITYITIVPMIRYDAFGGAFIAAGPSIGIATASSLHAQESFTQGGYTFQDGGTTRNLQPDGPIPNINTFSFSLEGEIGYAIPLAHKLLLVPALTVDLPLTPVESDANWKIMTYRLTAAVEWTIQI